jgi:hypothetical protein
VWCGHAHMPMPAHPSRGAAGGVGMHQWNVHLNSKLKMAEITSIKTGKATLVSPALLGASTVYANRYEGCYLNGDCNFPSKPRIRIEAQKTQGHERFAHAECPSTAFTKSLAACKPSLAPKRMIE